MSDVLSLALWMAVCASAQIIMEVSLTKCATVTVAADDDDGCHS